MTMDRRSLYAVRDSRLLLLLRSLMRRLMFSSSPSTAANGLPPCQDFVGLSYKSARGSEVLCCEQYDSGARFSRAVSARSAAAWRQPERCNALEGQRREYHRAARSRERAGLLRMAACNAGCKGWHAIRAGEYGRATCARVFSPLLGSCRRREHDGKRRAPPISSQVFHRWWGYFVDTSKCLSYDPQNSS